MPKPKSIIINGRRWFNKSTGNTYHSATIIVDGEYVEGVPYAYGYDQQYVDSAFAKLVALNIIEPPKERSSGGHEPLWLWAKENGITLQCSATDVKRKKDL